ncbi:MAG: nickel pincer cofactor biosynthesis protein LarB [Deltaproteobacteria bacterium]|nr:nickel pincer cofactor biosynthesis protein LarB [Deltaproteobacteria bacterium]
MDEKDVADLLEAVRAGDVSVPDAVDRFKVMPVRSALDVNIDSHRRLRRGLPEVVFAQGKSDEQLISAVLAAKEADGACIITRLLPKRAEMLVAQPGLEGLSYSQTARMARFPPARFKDLGRGLIFVVSAGTSDVPVAEEAAITCEALGNRVTRAFDVGVAGLHRLLEHMETIQKASVIIVAAGMEGALPSVVAGLAPCPVVAVPTSIGYGASFGGLSALLAMLNSCAGGVTVVNIDNGFGAGVAASLMNRKRPFDEKETTP